MVLGSYYLTLAASDEALDEYEAYKAQIGGVPSDNDEKYGRYTVKFYEESCLGRGSIYRNFDEAVMAYENKCITLHTPIKIRVTREINGESKTGIIDATLGRLIFNENIPQDLGWVNRNDPEHCLDLEVTFVATKGKLGEIVDRCIKKHGASVTAQVLDKIKAMGFKYSTRGAISIAVPDMTIPKQKKTLIEAAEKRVEQITEYFNHGVITDEERYDAVVATWNQTTNEVTNALQSCLDLYNPIKMMSDSGARGSIKQMRQLAGMRGLMFATSGKTMEIPIKSNFREGLNVLDYFVGARGSRKSLADTALRTADSGYLTRRLVDVSQEVIIYEENCGATEGLVVTEIKNGNETIEKFKERLFGRYTVHPVVDPATGEVIAGADVMLNDEMCDRIIAAGITEVEIRTVLKCKARHGVCAHCYGMDLATTKQVNVGEAVGIIAAQSIGEPGTQLTMRTFHTGGIAGSDITQGLPRVEELFEARRPKKTAVISELDGTVSIVETKRARNVTVKNEETGESWQVAIPNIMSLTVKNGDHVFKGEPMSDGSMAPADILHTKGLSAVYDYIITEVQKVYRSQSVDINDKHIEVITRQMTRKIRVEDPGDTSLLVGAQIDINEFNDENDKIAARNAAGEMLRPATGEPVLLGITKASLGTESFLSAASFQETTKVLTDAAIRGKVDNLLGLKENVIIGKLIPAGTGMDKYRSIGVEQNTDLSEF